MYTVGSHPSRRTLALRETYVVNFTKVKTPQRTPQVVVIQNVVKLSRSCGGFVVVLWWPCGEVVV